MKRLGFSLLLTIFFLSEACFSQQSFMPENDLYKEDRINELESTTEHEFLTVLKQVENFYKPIVQRHGASLVFINDWKDPTVNAYATQIGKRWEVHMFGGLARRKEMTIDGFQLVACHEVGHHLGGFPFVHEWAANEGQSDYFAALSCARELWKHDLVKNAAAALSVPRHPKRLCDQAWSRRADRNLCYRVAQAGKSLADLLSRGTAKYETSDKTVVSSTVNHHPGGQCRLDTYLAGASCKVSFDVSRIPRNEKDSAKVSCARPRCWFKPTISFDDDKKKVPRNFGVVEFSDKHQIYRSAYLGKKGLAELAVHLEKENLPFPKTIVYMNKPGYAFPFYFALEEYEAQEKYGFSFYHSFGEPRTYLDGHNPYEPTDKIDRHLYLGLKAKKYFGFGDGEITGGVDNLLKIVELIIDPKNQPVLFHCFGGFHRTGMVAMIMRHMQGWSWEGIEYEYRMFNPHFPRQENIAFVRKFVNDPSYLDLAHKYPFAR